MRYKHYIAFDERTARQKTEIHNQRPGDGITPELYYQILNPLGFDVKLYPHNHNLGAEVLLGQLGKSSWRMRLSQQLSGMNPDSTSSAQSIMCIAKRLC